MKDEVILSDMLSGLLSGLQKSEIRNLFSSMSMEKKAVLLPCLSWEQSSVLMEGATPKQREKMLTSRFERWWSGAEVDMPFDDEKVMMEMLEPSRKTTAKMMDRPARFEELGVFFREGLERCATQEERKESPLRNMAWDWFKGGLSRLSVSQYATANPALRDSLLSLNSSEKRILAGVREIYAGLSDVPVIIGCSKGFPESIQRDFVSYAESCRLKSRFSSKTQKQPVAAI